MKSLFKVTLVAGAIVFALAGCNEKSGTTVDLKVESQKESYAMGASFGSYISESFQAQGIELNGDVVIQGFSDAFKGKSLLSKEEIQQSMMAFQTRMMEEARVKQEKEAAENLEKGSQFRTDFEKQDGVQRTASGLLYKIENPGTGPHPTPEDVVVVHYKGTLIDGQEFDSSYSRNEPTTFQLGGVIPGWTEGIQLIGIGGKIKLVIPPDLAYGDSSLPGGPDRVGIPTQSTLVFEVELVNIQE